MRWILDRMGILWRDSFYSSAVTNTFTWTNSGSKNLHSIITLSASIRLYVGGLTVAFLNIVKTSSV